jgi:UDP-GlcNAc:undecaprenyl-phosphate GlcNAc-1-phosphate transferase
MVVFFVGVWDDFRPVPAWVKFLFQAAAAGIAIWFGVRIEHVSLLGGNILDLGMLAFPLTFLWIVGITNAFNLADGLDGLAAGLASIAAGTCAAIFLLRGDAQDTMLLTILLGALLGFLRYNFNPSTIFLGDSGSLMIGYILGVTAITGSQKGATALAVVIPLLVFGLPILDTLLSMIRRFVSGLSLIKSYKAPLKERILCAKRMFEADQGHIHHKLIAIGLSHRNAVLILYTLALGLSLMALISVAAQYRNAGIILVSVGLATYIGIRKLGYEEVAFLRRGTLLRWYEQLPFNRLFYLGFVDIVLITAAYWGAFVLKYELASTMDFKPWYLSMFPLVLLVQLGAFYVFGLYRGVWRAMGVGDLIRVSLAVGSSVALSYIVTVISMPPTSVLSFFCIDLLVLGILVVGTRSAYRVLDYARQREVCKGGGVLVYGAGRGGQLILNELFQNTGLGLRPVGFLDDNPTLRGRTVNRVPVLGTSDDLASITKTRSISSLIISSTKITGDRLDKVINLCQERHITVLQGYLQLEPIVEKENGSKWPPASVQSRRRLSKEYSSQQTSLPLS